MIMKKKTMHLFVVSFLMLGLARVSFAQYDTVFSKPPAFTMSLDSVIHGSSPSPGDTVMLMVQFTPNISGNMNLRLNFPGIVAPPNQGVGETSRDSTITVDSGTAYTYYFPLRLFDYGGAFVESILTPDSSYPNLLQMGYQRVETVLGGGGSFTVNNGRTYSGDTGSVIADIPGPGSCPVHLAISGKVDYYDYWQSALKGAFDVRVVLLFHAHGSEPSPCFINAGGQMSKQFAHPVSGCIEGVHYSTVDVNGNFSFDFTVDNLCFWDNEFYDVVLLVTNWNDATFLVPRDAANTNGSEVQAYTISGSPCGSWSTFTEPYSQCFACPHSNTISISNAHIGLNSNDGPVLRNEQFSQNFYVLRPVDGGAKPAQVNTLIIPNKQWYFSIFGTYSPY
jgi:hypothetical protein